MKQVTVTDDLRKAVERLRERVRVLANDEERIGLQVRSDLWSVQGDIESIQFKLSGCDDPVGCPYDDDCGDTCKAARS
jgi:hypothetical protein